MKDTYKRNINYLRISVTDFCNLRCKYCMPEAGVEKMKHCDVLSIEEIVKIAKESASLGIRKVRITGGEPLVRKGIIDLIKGISAIEGIEDIAMTTNGLLLKEYGKELKEAGLKRVNISIDSLDPHRYREITRGGEVEKVLEGIEEALTLGLDPIKLNTVIIGGENEEDIRKLMDLTKVYPIDVRFIELMPIGEASSWSKKHFISNEEIRKRVPELVPQLHETASPAQYYKLPSAKGRVGFIDPISSHFCSECNRLRVTFDGKLKPCLHSSQEIDLLPALREETGSLRELLAQAIASKPEKHFLDTVDYKAITRNMSQIGG
ncbi:GTP 3',8-cyclase MoaA [Isachenkonia alkalipeptolytica]|uniref:GTP 3',8-cyclase n=1 Tax=Isachenkonia alkalipeptolytica TaxID=2565777 RepID=A0AA44BEB1_9CLOT|nr:GTP 3',8-cyclase MoaA [Isachenkonia alkalipeptolytica]NBG87326.1 GTP 3',8-cyclase MoaA [Isachenkonia alkalipeptolytica]